MSQPENSAQLFKVVKKTAEALANHENQYKEGRWEKDERVRFIKSCLMFGNDWKKVKEFVKTRRLGQIRSHAQKFILQICKNQSVKNKEFMDHVKRLDFKSKNYSQLFKDDIHLLNKDCFTAQEMDEIERKIILKFKINYSKEYECLNYKNETSLQKEKVKKSKKRARIKTFDEFSPVSNINNFQNPQITLPHNQEEYREILLRKINQHLNKIRILATAYNNLYGNPVEDIKLREQCSQAWDFSTEAKESDRSIRSVNVPFSIEEDLVSSFDLDAQNDVFSLFNVGNVEQFCSRSFISNEEDELVNID